jgi:hypothetical protein
MVIKYKILAILLLLNYTTFSQIDTTNICLPYETVQKIAIELIQKDSLKAELQETQKLVEIFNVKISYQDSTILILEQKETNYLSQINNLTLQDSLHTEEVARLRQENIDLSKKNENLKTTTKLLGVGFLGTLAALIIFI